MAEIYTPLNLQIGNYPKVDDIVIVAAGASLVAGSVLGRITASGKYKLCNSVAVDGSQVPRCVLAEAAAAAAVDVSASVYLSGDYDQNQLVFGGADTVATHRDGLRAMNIYPQKAVA
jgi:hypothetical protein